MVVHQAGGCTRATRHLDRKVKNMLSVRAAALAVVVAFAAISTGCAEPAAVPVDVPAAVVVPTPTVTFDPGPSAADPTGPTDGELRAPRTPVQQTEAALDAYVARLAASGQLDARTVEDAALVFADDYATTLNAYYAAVASADVDENIVFAPVWARWATVGATLSRVMPAGVGADPVTPGAAAVVEFTLQSTAWCAVKAGYVDGYALEDTTFVVVAASCATIGYVNGGANIPGV
jgi:hypothetical protein